MEYKDVPWDNSAANPESYINCWGVTDSYDSTSLILDFGKDFITAEDFEKKLLSNKNSKEKSTTQNALPKGRKRPHIR